MNHFFNLDIKGLVNFFAGFENGIPFNPENGRADPRTLLLVPYWIHTGFELSK